MRSRVFVLALAIALAASGPAGAQGQQTGDIFGKVTDQSGGALPGVTVTLTSPILLQPQIAVTSETGTYQFPRLNIGTYAVRFELTGFKTVIKEDIIITVGFSAPVNVALLISAVQETITVTGESPIVSTRETGTKQTFTNELLQSIPSARDPWVILQQTAGIAMDRENIGGNMSGQQSNYVSRGGNPFNNKWSLDGVDITDMSATGSSPGYFDFDAFQEMTVNTGGVDVTQQTGGVGINLVTKSGSDRFHGSSRFYVTDDSVEGQNITDAQRTQGATSGNPIQNIQDYGIEAGGPLKKGKAWIWGSVGKQLVDVGVINFYQKTATCNPIAANPIGFPIEDVNNCLNTDETLLLNTNVKAEVMLFKDNRLTVFNNFSKKERNARGASDLNPIETTTPQGAVPGTYGVGKSGWTIGPSPTYKVGDQHVFSDRMLMDVQWAHVGNNFILDFHDPSLATIQPTYIINSPAGLNGRSGTQNIYIRPVNSVTVNMNYFLPGKMGGDHSFKIGGYWRDSYSYSTAKTGGNATARFPTDGELANANDCATLTAGCQVTLTRDGQTTYDLLNYSAYVQDTLNRGKATFQLGVRYDYNHDQALASGVGASPLTPTILPAVNFNGADPKIAFNNFSPRLGFTYNVKGDGKTVLRANYASYFGQVGLGGVSGQINPVTSVSLRYKWLDANHDRFVQPNEIYDSNNALLLSGGNSAKFLAASGNWDPANPGSPTTANTIDPNIRNDRTDEVIVGADHEIGLGFAVGGSYIWRRYSYFTFYPDNALARDGSSFVPVSFTPTGCPAGATCPTVTYYQPAPGLAYSNISTEVTYPGDMFNRSFNGVELTGRKRMSNRWLMNTSFAYNSTIVNYNGVLPSGSGNQDPTNLDRRNGYQYDYSSTGSGIGNVYVNAKWLYKLSGLYEFPGSINVSGFYNARQGYPFRREVQGPSRTGGAGIPSVLLDNVGDSRLPTYQNVDVHVERPVKAGTLRFVPAMDIFNVFNSNTEQAIRGVQTSSNANNIQAIVAPRVMRFGVRVIW
jgi:Carboxypeptidase regulatory-like domain/TonB-dependent Receptor Plug Domain